jgi:AraC family transcriptional regulator
MEVSRNLKGGSFGEQRSLDLVGGFVVSETVHRKGQMLARHAHERASINFVLGGAYSETFRGSSHAYTPDTIVIKPAGEEHANHFREVGARCLLIELTPARTASLQACFDSARAPSSRVTPALKPVALRIVRELRAPDSFSRLAVEAHILELLVETARAYERTDAGHAPRWLQNVVARLRDDTALPQLSELAVDAGVHPAHLTRAFRKHFHSTPGEYARRARLERAIALLTSTEEPIGHIAVRAGFFDQSHFTRCVKQATGMSPGELRGALK